jgi:two-component system sensor histidine kinase BarA
VLLIDLFLTTNHINNSIDQATQLLQTKGEIIAKQIASASEFYLFSGDHGQIQRLLNQTRNRDDVIFSAVYDQQGMLVGKAEGSVYSAEQIPFYFYFRQPIQTESIDSSDIFEPDSTTSEPDTRTLGWVRLYVSKQKLKQQKVDIYREGIAFFITMLVIAAILSSIISRRITRPVFSLLDYLNRIEKGHLGLTIKDLQHNEIGEVQKGFNSMSQSLLANRRLLDDKIKTATHELTNAITDLEYKNQDLAIARDEAQDAYRIKSQFLANMSHEIRTPINGIKGFINLLSRSGLQENQKRYADIIRQSSDDLSSIIGELLDFSKIESGKIEILHAPFDLHEVLERTRDSLFSSSMEKGIDLYLTIYSDTPRYLTGDQYRLKQILINLIGNAIKFTDDGHVKITVYIHHENDDSSDIKFLIEDTGIGIAAQDQEVLFEAFKQIESDTNRRFSGTGLGLVISQNLAQLMGGDIELQSKPDSGSLFTLTLPFKNAQPQHDKMNPFSNDTAMIYTSNELCQQEIQSLYNRIGFITETQIIDSNTDVFQLQSSLLQNLSYISLIVFDLRNSLRHPDELFTPQLRNNARIILMHYDQSLIQPSEYSAYEFIPVVNTSHDIKRHLIKDKPDTVDELSEPIVHPAPTPARVLLVDDNEINLKLVIELTRLWGHIPIGASNAYNAIRLFETQQFDLILLDIQMPEIDGIRLMQMIRESCPDIAAPIAAITANVTEQEKHRLLDLGFDAYLSKPIEEDILRNLLDKKEIIETRINNDSHDLDIVNNRSIDVDLSLKLCANNEQLVMDMFKLLKRGIPDYQLQLKEAINARSRGKLAFVTHKLQGIICYTGLPRLKQFISCYEATKHQDSDETFNVCAQMINELDAINASLESLIPESTH